MTKIPSDYREQLFLDTFGDRITTENGIKALETADILSDMILFHSLVRKNGEKMLNSMN